MQKRFGPVRAAVPGAVAAALLGLAAGAWMKPPATQAADPDPYENVVITLPEPSAGPDYPLQAAGWVPAPPPAEVDSPDSGIEAAASPAAWSPPWESVPAGAEASSDKLDEVLPPPPRDSGPDWPSARGDILAVSEPAAPAGPPSPPEPARARSPDPRDWDVPASAYTRNGFEMRARAEAAADPVG